MASDTTKATGALNRIGAKRLRVATGSADSLDGAYDGILRNTCPRVLEQVVPRLRAMARPGAWLAVSGFREAETARMEALLAENGWSVERRRHDGDWHALEARHTG